MHSQFIEVGIGLIFVYLTMSIMVSGINEAILSIFSQRGKFLKKTILQIFNDPRDKNWGELIYEHPLICSFTKNPKRPPSYITSNSFALSLFEVVIKHGNIEDNTLSPFEKFKASVEKMNEGRTKDLLLSSIDNAQGSMEKLLNNIEHWYNEYMDRVSGWYKKRVHKIIMGISIVLTIFLNVDTISLSSELWNNTVLREAIANSAEGYIHQVSADTTGKLHKDTTFEAHVSSIKTAYASLGMLDLPIGWNVQLKYTKDLQKAFRAEKARLNSDTSIGSVKRFFKKTGNLIGYYWDILLVFISSIGMLKFLGWAFTAVAISYGAPFWFDLLNKFINLRKSLKSGGVGPLKK